MVISSDVGLQPRVVARGVTQAFGGKPVLHDLDLEVAAGEFVVLIGHSGSGKSTLLRLIAGLDSPTSGELAVTGTTSLGFQEARLLPWDRVKDNVLFGLRGAGSRSERDEVARRALREVKLEHRADAWPGTLSGGEAQRASLARALVREPDLLLLDEPFGALDALTRSRLQGELQRIWQKEKITMLLVTHDVEEAVFLGDRVVVMQPHPGRIRRIVDVNLPHPRSRSDPRFIALRDDVLSDFLDLDIPAAPTLPRWPEGHSAVGGLRLAW
jgi:sulfonate transport system ATP-binding protein